MRACCADSDEVICAHENRECATGAPAVARNPALGREEVQVTQQDQVVAMVVPAKPVATPDFLARAKAVWGETPTGNPLSAVVSEARGGEP